MSYGMYISAEGAKVQSQRLEFIANNLANLDTVGFKRDIPTFQARFAEAIQQGTDYSGSKTRNDLGGGVKMIDVQTEFLGGALRATEVKTDFAINGEGFFQVRTQSGEVLLTRAGDFNVDAQGRLLTQTGRYEVLDDGGGAIKIDPGQPWELMPGGMIDQGGSQVAIGLQKPESLGDLVKVGNNAFRSLSETFAIPAGQRDILQGHLEQSGVNSTTEMMAMIETTRAFEANTKMIQNQDGMVSALLSRVLRS